MFAQAAEFVASWKQPLLLSHAKPDGDALGSLIAMRAMLRSRGAEAVPLLFDPLPSRYAAFERYGAMPILGRDRALSDLARFDGIILLDTCSFNQVHPIADWIRSASQPKLAVDHHITRDEMVDVYVVDEQAAATCLILHDWARATGWTIDRTAAEALFTGIAMDTGWFRFSNTDERTLSAAAELVAGGVRPNDLLRDLYQREQPSRIALLATALTSLEVLSQGRLAVMTLSLGDFAAAGASPTDTEDIINEPMRIGSVIVSILLAEREKGLVGVSFRSKPPFGEDSLDVDVAALAQSFGGGGHRRASAARIKGTLPHARSAVIDQVQHILGDSQPT